ncbi:DUF2171 domain-containing protein [Vitiosangium sp. GDMCC 1.1324]|uniref:DUF2171 domain-containing protein n=1 Tax=Vitiosangium sp. (strain GDMCC 1.1324) TaxID=2138576 RepID=UPI000D34ABCD|nr:DUF2171 domain-containing protein [Vitiosangium sp. GDMCC 1.1324]PTL76793.1 DUF2171 domain-containing protein [Vitiosangium sp. GDMCC 1.1324]
MVTRDDVHEGMVVLDADGRRVGYVRALGEEHFELEPRLLSSEEYLVEYKDVRRVHHGELHLVPHGEVYLKRQPHLLKVEDDDGSALPPRHHEAMDAEPVNLEEVEKEAHHAGS